MTELEELKEELERQQSLIDQCFEGMETAIHFAQLVLDHPNAKEWGIWRRALMQNLDEVQWKLAEALEVEVTQ
ncbi:MAG: hypothetical protein V3V47_00315 [Desulfobacteria bacterium]